MRRPPPDLPLRPGWAEAYGKWLAEGDVWARQNGKPPEAPAVRAPRATRHISRFSRETLERMQAAAEERADKLAAQARTEQGIPVRTS